MSCLTSLAMSKAAPVTVDVLPASIQNQAESVSYLLRVLLFLEPSSRVPRLHARGAASGGQSVATHSLNSQPASECAQRDRRGDSGIGVLGDKADVTYAPHVAAQVPLPYDWQLIAKQAGSAISKQDTL